ncbi:hypothetical protein [Streptomyces mirabilis]|uniref:hypothetical protein n=1 Tax=Streptomyces mirabilis TaxID=68239 RepID=UPI0036D97198
MLPSEPVDPWARHVPYLEAELIEGSDHYTTLMLRYAKTAAERLVSPRRMPSQNRPQRHTRCVADEDPNKELAAHEPLFEVAERDPDDTTVLIHPSGSTGQPKGTETAHTNLREITPPDSP